MLREFYETVGGDYEAAREAFKEEKRMLRFLRRFPEDPSYAQLTDAMSKPDLDAAFHAAHSLKGVALTLRLTALYEAASEVTEALRAADEPLARAGMPRLEEVYRRTADAVSEL